MPGGWAGSTRSATLPAEWRRIRARILERDRASCTWVTDGDQCGQPANEVDHIGDRLTHTDSNLRALCTWHHSRRSSAQGNQARQPLRTTRTPEPHPGIRANRHQ